MQSLLYGIFYRNGDRDKNNDQSQPKLSFNDYETLGCPEAQTIVQIHRKIKLTNEFKNYTTNQNNLYYRYIMGTTIHEYEHDKPVIYTILASPFFGTLYPYKTSQDPDEFLRMMGSIHIH